MTWDSAISFELVLKILLLPAMASALALLFRRRSAAVQHLVLVAGLLGLVALPVLAALTPSWSLVEIPGTLEALVRWSNIETSGAAAQPPIGGSSPPGFRSFTSLSELAGFGWLAGALAVVLRWLVSRWRSRNVLREAVLERSPRLCRTMEEVCHRLDVRRRVGLLRGGQSQMPFTVGVLRPRVVLPADAEQWSSERLEMVLLHELSHVRRFDILAQHLCSIASALYWFHPLVWWMSRRSRAVSERAADDEVLRSGASAPDYAEQLVLLARRYRGSPSWSPAMTGGLFEERLEALLAEGRRRVSLGGLRCALALALALVLTVAVSACSRTDATPVEAEAEASVNAERSQTRASDLQVLIDIVIIETSEALVNWDAIGDAARGNPLSLISIGDDSQSLEQRLMTGERDGRLKILSAPKIMTVDGERVFAQSGLQIPVQTAQGGTISTQYVNATLRIEIRPLMVGDDVVEVELTIQKRFPRHELAKGDINVPISTIEASSRFRVRLGGTMVIAGMRDTSLGSEQDLIAFVTVREIRL